MAEDCWFDRATEGIESEREGLRAHSKCLLVRENRGNRRNKGSSVQRGVEVRRCGVPRGRRRRVAGELGRWAEDRDQGTGRTCLDPKTVLDW